MNIKYHGHKNRQEKARELWMRVATDYNGNIPAAQIAKRYKITRSHVYWILKQMEKLTVN